MQDPKFLEIKDRIKEVLQDDAHIIRGAGSHLQRCFAVRPNINGLLDVARRLYSELITDIQDKVNQLAELYKLPLRLNSNVTRGFHIVLSLGAKNKNQFNVKNLPSVFIEVEHKFINSFFNIYYLLFSNVLGSKSWKYSHNDY